MQLSFSHASCSITENSLYRNFKKMRKFFCWLTLILSIGASLSEDCESLEASMELCSANKAFKLPLPTEGRTPDITLCSGIADLVKTCSANYTVCYPTFTHRYWLHCEGIRKSNDSLLKRLFRQIRTSKYV